MVKIQSRKRIVSSKIRLPIVFIGALGSFALFSIKSKDFIKNNIIRTYFSTPILGDLHTARRMHLWKQLLEEGEALYTNSRIHVMEVGMQNADACLDASELNAQAHCVEHFPSSNNQFRSRLRYSPKDLKDNIRFYQMAGSDTTGLHVEFGHVNTWTMTKEISDEHEIKRVKSVAIDDIIDNKVEPTKDFSLTGRKPDDKIDKLFMLKIDTEGNEPRIFEGMQRAIQENKIDFIITRYWPKGIDLVNDSMGSQECTKPVAMLTQLREAGYTLYTMAIASHAKAPRNGAQEKIQKHNRGKLQTPIDDLMAHCMWFYELERKNPGKFLQYQMGYWTDILAVAPGARLPERPITAFGRMLAKHL